MSTQRWFRNFGSLWTCPRNCPIVPFVENRRYTRRKLPHCREIFRSAGHQAVCYQSAIKEIGRRIKALAGGDQEGPIQAQVPILTRIAPTRDNLITQNIQAVKTMYSADLRTRAEDV